MSEDNQDIPEKVIEYERFVNEVLRKDLEKVLSSRDEIFAQIAEYLQLRTTIEKIQETGCENEELKTQIDLGCNFYAQAKVQDASMIFVQIGFGFFVEFTLKEALKFIDKKTKLLTQQSEKLTQDSAKIKAHIKLVYEGLREIQHLNKDLPKEHRSVFT
ncbi:protein UXT homolog [Strongylocentrotus purpuratus]|uniref:Protein UXT n=1 Tax=Strongylocentrotus purpuratus TaxID=7668 RepID=A0A7M7N0N6_STRPU|nr:protein UXT homolog [Strongylocentrotus purpuratus]